MKIDIEIPPLTHEFLSELVDAGDYATINDAIESCFNSGLDKKYEHYQNNDE